MKGYILILAILLQITCNNQEQSKLVQAKDSVQIDTRDKSLKLKFKTGIGLIFEDSKGNYWFGSHKEGIAIFNGKSFEYLTIDKGLPSHQISSIQEDDSGNIWIGTSNGVSRYDGTRITNYTPIEKDNSENKWIKKEKDLWFPAANKEGIYRFDGQELNYLAFPNPKVINSQNKYFVTSLSKGRNNKLWIGTYAGVFGYNGSDFTIINDETLGLNINTEPLHIRSLFEDSKGRLWIGNNGIGVLQKEGDNIINFSEKYNLIHPTSSRRGEKSLPGTLEHVFAIEEDGDGNIWFGDRDTGVWKYDGETINNYTKKEGLTNDFILTIYKDNKDELWIGLMDGNVFKFNGKTFDKQF